MERLKAKDHIGKKAIKTQRYILDSFTHINLEKERFFDLLLVLKSYYGKSGNKYYISSICFKELTTFYSDGQNYNFEDLLRSMVVIEDVNIDDLNELPTEIKVLSGYDYSVLSQIVLLRSLTFTGDEPVIVTSNLGLKATLKGSFTIIDLLMFLEKIYNYDIQEFEVPSRKDMIYLINTVLKHSNYLYLRGGIGSIVRRVFKSFFLIKKSQFSPLHADRISSFLQFVKPDFKKFTLNGEWKLNGLNVIMQFLEEQSGLKILELKKYLDLRQIYLLKREFSICLFFFYEYSVNNKSIIDKLNPIKHQWFYNLQVVYHFFARFLIEQSEEIVRGSFEFIYALFLIVLRVYNQYELLNFGENFDTEAEIKNFLDDLSPFMQIYEKLKGSIVKRKGITVFLSYSTLDTTYFKIPEIVARLEKYPQVDKVFFLEKKYPQIDIVYDPRALTISPASETYSFKCMETTLKRSNLFLLFCSINIFRSKVVQDEWEVAYNMEQKGELIVIPVFEDSDFIPFNFITRPSVKFDFTNLEKTIKEILSIYNLIKRI